MHWAKQGNVKQAEDRYWLSRVPAIRSLKEKDLSEPEFISPQARVEAVEAKDEVRAFPVSVLRVQGAVVVPLLGECQIDLHIADLRLTPIPRKSHC
jgi:hypothetical protein